MICSMTHLMMGIICLMLLVNFISMINILFHILKLVKKSHCKTELSNGQYLRQYIGNENMTKNGTACLNWITVTEAEKLIGVDHVGDHNYCRNPNKTQDREFCYISQNVTEFCRVRTCGMLM